MAKPRKDQKPKVEQRPDGWERFGTAVDAAIKSGPKHREAPSGANRKRKADKKTAPLRRGRR